MVRQTARQDEADGRYERILPPMAPPLLPETKKPAHDGLKSLIPAPREPQWMERYFIARCRFQLCFLTFGFAFLQ